jgi:hypothetical protein
MNQPDLFYESFEEALRDDVKALGGLKKVGPVFWPEKDTEGAARSLADKLNSGRRDRLTDEQERFIMRRAREVRGFSAALYYICDDTHFDRPKAKVPEDERDSLLRTANSLAQGLKQCVDRLERLSTPPLHSIGGGRE